MKEQLQTLGMLAGVACIALAVAGCDRVFGVQEVRPVDGGDPNAYACACTCKVRQGAPVEAISQSADDAEENTSADSTVTLTDPVLHLTQGTTVRQFVGLRFQNVQIPKGTTITSAYIQFTAAQDGSAPTTNLEWVGQASNSAKAFTTANSDISTRPETTATSGWSPGPWVAGEAGAAERSSDLTGILTEIVSRSGWATGNPVVLILRGGGDRVAVSFDGDPSQAPRLVVNFAVPGDEVFHELQVCMPADLNPSLNGGTTPTGEQLSADCSGRVQDTLSGINGACGLPSDCTCARVLDAPSHFADSCTDECGEVPLDPACANFEPGSPLHTATNAPGDEPVCAAFSPISAELFGQQSLCEIADGGTAFFTSDDDSETTPARGQVTFIGRPCPGGACPVGMSVLLDADPITFSNFFGSATFVNLAGLGESFAGGEAMLGTDGTGAFAPGSLHSAGRGDRIRQAGLEGLALVGNNGDALPVVVDWAGRTCAVSGTLVGSVDPELKRCEDAGPSAGVVCTDDSQCTDDDACTDGVCNCLPVPPTDVTVGLSVTGTLVNQPPSIQAGADQVVECNAAGQGEFTLSATASDPDANIALYTWFRGGNAGPVVGWTPTIPFAQPVGTTESYGAQVIDAFAQADLDTTQIQVVDTTPPLIDCGALATIPPPTRPIVFTATATDICDPDVVPTLSDAVCFKLNGNGKRVDKNQACDVVLSGNSIQISPTNGIGEHIQWTATVTDTSGNPSSTTCETVVAQP